MELFNKRFVYLEWDDVLAGKEVFVADTLPELRSRVEHDGQGLICTVKKNEGIFPFVVDTVCYAFVYYDPNYACKRAYAQGKTIQYRDKDSSNSWKNCSDEPFWTDECEYRVKPEEKEDSKCNSCSYQCEPDMPCNTCRDGSNYKPRVIVHKKRRMTNHELAKWIAQGNGQAKHRDSNYIMNTYETYDVRDGDKPCPFYLEIRNWDETEWHTPEVEEE